MNKETNAGKDEGMDRLRTLCLCLLVWPGRGTKLPIHHLLH